MSGWTLRPREEADDVPLLRPAAPFEVVARCSSAVARVMVTAKHAAVVHDVHAHDGRPSREAIARSSARRRPTF